MKEKWQVKMKINKWQMKLLRKWQYNGNSEISNVMEMKIKEII